MNFIILSNQQFDSELKTNKWHISNQLAQKGHKVIFVDPPLRFRAVKRFIKNPSLNLFKLMFEITHVNSNLMVYKPTHYFNFRPFSDLNTFLHSRKISDCIKNHFNQDKTIMYIYHFDYPDLQNFVGKFKFDKLVYDCVDDYREFPEYKDQKFVNTGIVNLIQKFDFYLKVYLNQNGLKGALWVDNQESWLCKKANHVFAVSPDIVNKLKKFGVEAIYLPNACDAIDFDLQKTQVLIPDDLKNIPHPIVGFTGAIDKYKNDLDLIKNCAVKYPNYSFVLIGPTKLTDPDTDLKDLKILPNVYFLEQKSQTVMPNYFNNFDAYFIPYNPKTYTGFPVKYFESLATGLPTIVTDLSAYQGFDVDGYVSKTYGQFIENIKLGIEQNDAEKVKKRKKLAYQNTWSGKADKIVEILKSK